jgi:hypothetical protein
VSNPGGVGAFREVTRVRRGGQRSVSSPKNGLFRAVVAPITFGAFTEGSAIPTTGAFAGLRRLRRGGHGGRPWVEEPQDPAPARAGGWCLRPIDAEALPDNRFDLRVGALWSGLRALQFGKHFADSRAHKVQIQADSRFFLRHVWRAITILRAVKKSMLQRALAGCRSWLPGGCQPLRQRYGRKADARSKRRFGKACFVVRKFPFARIVSYCEE